VSDLTVSQAAARLGISERTVQRRCKRGTITARLETTPDGTQWLINGATLPTGDGTTADTADKVTTHTNAPARSQNECLTADNGATLPTPRDKVPTGDDTRLLDHLQAENSFLREQIEAWRLQAEAANRTAAETSAALRKALDQMPKAITDGEKLEQVRTDTARENASESPIIPADEQSGLSAKQSAQRGVKPRKLTAWQRIGARILGIR
jgi:excisionase family DNA binding protein